MPSQKPKLILVIEDELMEKIDDFRFDNRIQSRSEAVRRLIQKGLEAEKDNTNPLPPSKKP